MIKLIATDMDGTWLNSKKEYDLDKFKQIMDLAREKGSSSSSPAATSMKTWLPVFRKNTSASSTSWLKTGPMS